MSGRAAVVPRIEQGACRGRHRPPAAPDIMPDRSVLAFESDARQRGLQKPRVPIAGLDHEGDRHAAQDGELVDDRPCWGGLGGSGLGRHARVRLQRECHGPIGDFRGFSSWRSRRRRNSMQDARNRMILTVSGGANRHAAWAAATLDLESIAQRTLARRAPCLADPLVVRAARPGGFLLGVAGAAIPNAFSERHAISFRRGSANSRVGGASDMPASPVRCIAVLTVAGRAGREVRCRLLPR